MVNTEWQGAWALSMWNSLIIRDLFWGLGLGSNGRLYWRGRNGRYRSLR